MNGVLDPLSFPDGKQVPQRDRPFFDQRAVGEMKSRTALAATGAAASAGKDGGRNRCVILAFYWADHFRFPQIVARM